MFTPDGEEFPGDPRSVLRRNLREAAKLGYVFHTGPELEFFLLKGTSVDDVSLLPRDHAGYFDVAADAAAGIR